MPPTSSSHDLAVIGAGIGGLSRCYQEKKGGRSVVVLEKSNRPGGVIHSEWLEGYLLEYGPNTVQLTPELASLIGNLRLQSEMEVASSKTPRYVLFGGKLQPVPVSIVSFLTTGLLSWPGRARMLREPFIQPRKNRTDETLMAFARRRLGDEAAERLLAPFVSGVWAGNADQLSAQSSFPGLSQWEHDHGSLFKGMLAKKKSNRGLLSFKNGLQTLTNALASELDDEIRYGEEIQKIQPNSDGTWAVTSSSSTITTKEVVLTLPAWEAARLVRPLSPEASATLTNIEYASVAVLHVAYETSRVKRRTNGFGFLSAPGERSDILGCLWSSSLFADHAPKGKFLMTVFMGGANNEKVLEYRDTALLTKAIEALRGPMQLDGEPAFTRVTRIERAIPQYTMGHNERIRLLEKVEQKFPGLHFRGNYRGGISVGDVVRSQFQKSS